MKISRYLLLCCLLIRTDAFLKQSRQRRDYCVPFVPSSHIDDSLMSSRLHRKPIMAATSNDDESSSSKARVRFSGVNRDSQSATVSNPADYALSWIASDIGSIVLGLAGIVLLLVGRLVLDTPDDNDLQDMGQATRSNLLAVFAAGAVLLNGLSKLDVESTMAQPVALVGKSLPAPLFLDDDQQHPTEEWKWVFESLLAATPTDTAVVLEQSDNGGSWNKVAVAGIVPSTEDEEGQLDDDIISATPIINRSVTQDAETYLPTLQALPGRTEFTYLPPNTQAALILPVVVQQQQQRNKMVLVLGSDQAKSYTPRDIAWCQVVVTRVAEAY